MNRSILIVICDFLLVSLLAFSTVDINKVADEGVPRVAKTEIATNQVDSGKDLAAVMRLALTEERKSRDTLLNELAKTRDAAGQQQARLSEREEQVRGFQQQLQARDEEARRLQTQQTNLQQQYTEAQGAIRNLNQQLQSTSSEAVLSKEKLAALEAEARKQAELAESLRQQLNQSAKSNQVVLAEKQQLAGQLQVAQTEKRFATEQAVRMQEEVKVERAEKAKLAEGVQALAKKSGELSQELRENRPLAPNTIFNDFATNRVEAHFSALKPGLLGLDSNKQRDSQTVLVTDGKQTFALCHVQDTPFTLWNPGTEWEALTGTLNRNGSQCAIRSLSFSMHDPRIVWIPISETEARDMGSKVYRLSPDPFKFQEAVLVGAREGYYGECRFQIDLSTPEYVKLDHNFLKGLFGKFNPSRGDLVFSKTGELLGIMANSTYCLMLRNFDSAATLRFGDDVRSQHTGNTLAMLYSFIADMPFKLQ